MDHFEPPKERPGRGGPFTWPSKVWSLMIDYGEGEGPGAKVGLVFWGVVILALVALGVYAIVISI